MARDKRERLMARDKRERLMARDKRERLMTRDRRERQTATLRGFAKRLLAARMLFQAD
jgi:hypothetical protein